MTDIIKLLNDEIGGQSVSDQAPCITKVRVLREAIDCIESLCRQISRLQGEETSVKDDAGQD